MEKIVFPGINLSLEISKIAFNIFGITIYWYAVLIVLALSIALILLKIRDGLYDIQYNEITTLMLYAIPICFISARLYYIIFEWQYFSQNLHEILNFRQRRACNIWRNNRRTNYLLCILQEKKNFCIKFNRLYSTSLSTSDRR